MWVCACVSCTRNSMLCMAVCISVSVCVCVCVGVDVVTETPFEPTRSRRWFESHWHRQAASGCCQRASLMTSALIRTIGCAADGWSRNYAAALNAPGPARQAASTPASVLLSMLSYCYYHHHHQCLVQSVVADGGASVVTPLRPSHSPAQALALSYLPYATMLLPACTGVELLPRRCAVVFHRTLHSYECVRSDNFFL